MSISPPIVVTDLPSISWCSLTRTSLTYRPSCWNAAALSEPRACADGGTGVACQPSPKSSHARLPRTSIRREKLVRAGHSGRPQREELSVRRGDPGEVHRDLLTVVRDGDPALERRRRQLLLCCSGPLQQLLGTQPGLSGTPGQRNCDARKENSAPEHGRKVGTA